MAGKGLFEDRIYVFTPGGEIIDLPTGSTPIDFAYSLLSHPESFTLMAFHLDDHFFGAEILRNAGIKVMYQQDLSR